MRDGRVVAITGAAGGVGALLVERFLTNGDTAGLITAAADISRGED